MLFTLLLQLCVYATSESTTNDVNLALDAPVISIFSGSSQGLTADVLDLSKGWVTTAFSNVPNHTLFPEFVAIDLGHVFNISSIVLLPSEEYLTAFPLDLAIDIANVGEPWRQVAIMSAVTPRANSTDALHIPFIPGSISGRLVRLSVSAMRNSSLRYVTAVQRLQVYGPNKQPITRPTLQAHHHGVHAPDLLCTAPSIPAASLTINYRASPAVGVDTPRPLFNWTFCAAQRGQTVIAYRVMVGRSSKAGDASIWDSGKVQSADARDLGALYAGVTALRAATLYSWQVTLWDIEGNSTVSDIATFITSKLDTSASAWTGSWIGTGLPAAHRGLYFRAPLHLPSGRPISRAVAMFCGLGYGELLIDGVKVSDYLLSPGFTQYNVRTQYVTFDVTDQLSATSTSDHAVGVILGDGWYSLSRDPWVHNFQNNVYVSTPTLLLDITVTFGDDDTQMTFGSNSSAAASWEWSYGKITRTWIGAENIDNTVALPSDWSTLSAIKLSRQFTVTSPHTIEAYGSNIMSNKDSTSSSVPNWTPVATSQGPNERFPGSLLVAQREAPTRVQGYVDPQTFLAQVSDDGGAAYVFNFGREFQGWVQLSAFAAETANITILFCGSMFTSCTFDTQPNEQGGPDQSLFTLAGNSTAESPEVWEPRFMYTSVYNVVIRTTAGVAPLSLSSVRGVLVAMDAPPISSFACSDDSYNWLHNTLARTHANYITGFPNDPTREKKGWTQDIESIMRSTATLFGSSRTMYPRWVQDIIDNLSNSSGSMGLLPEVAPGPVLNDGYNGAWWGGMGVFAPWIEYVMWGDPTVLLPHYPAMVSYVQYLNASGGQSHFQTWGLGDWGSVLPACANNATLINTPAFYLYALIVSETAALLGFTADSTTFRDLAASITASYTTAFLDASTGVIGSGEQCMQALALGIDELAQSISPGAPHFIPPTALSLVQDQLLAKIHKDGDMLTTGFVTFSFMLDVLKDLDVATGHVITTRKTGPAPWTMSAGTDHDVYKEFWDGSGAMMPNLAGALGVWSFEAVAGLRTASPGYRDIVIKPAVGVGNLTWCAVNFTSPRGLIAVAWSLIPTPNNATNSGAVSLYITIPPTAAASVFVPTMDAGSVLESGIPAGSSPGVTFVQQRGDYAVFSVVSGTFNFYANFSKS